MLSSRAPSPFPPLGECDDGGPGSEYALCTAGSEQTDCGCGTRTESSPPPPPFPPAVAGFDSPLDTIPVLNQEQCGSCYVFAATQVFRMRMGALSPLGSDVEISPEDVISCNSAGNGCNGGLPAQVFDFMEKSGAATCSSSCTAGCAPYEGYKESCPSSCSDGSSLTRFYATSSSGLLGGGWGSNNPATESSIMDEIRNKYACPRDVTVDRWWMYSECSELYCGSNTAEVRAEAPPRRPSLGRRPHGCARRAPKSCEVQPHVLSRTPPGVAVGRSPSRSTCRAISTISGARTRRR